MRCWKLFGFCRYALDKDRDETSLTSEIVTSDIQYNYYISFFFDLKSSYQYSVGTNFYLFFDTKISEFGVPAVNLKIACDWERVGIKSAHSSRFGLSFSTITVFRERKLRVK